MPAASVVSALKRLSCSEIKRRTRMAFKRPKQLKNQQKKHKNQHQVIQITTTSMVTSSFSFPQSSFQKSPPKSHNILRHRCGQEISLLLSDRISDWRIHQAEAAMRVKKKNGVKDKKSFHDWGRRNSPGFVFFMSFLFLSCSIVGVLVPACNVLMLTRRRIGTW